MSDLGTKYVSEIFRYIFQKLNIQQVVSSSYYHQGSRNVEQTIKLGKQKMKFKEANNDIHVALLQIILSPVWAGLPSPVTLLFHRSIKGLMSGRSRMLINYVYDEHSHYSLKSLQNKLLRNNDSVKEPSIIPVGSTAVI